jgi:hypothetical protein
MVATVDRKKMKVAVARNVSSKPNGFGSDIAARELKLTSGFARELNATLGVSIFKASRPFASSFSSTHPLSVKIVPVSHPHPGLRSGFMFFHPDPSALAKLETKGVTYLDTACGACGATITPISPARYAGGPRPWIAFYITGGRIAPDASSGIVTTAGGIRIATSDPNANPAVVIIKDIWLELDAGVVTAETEFLPSPPAPGNVGRTTIGAIDSSEAQVGSSPVHLSVGFTKGLVRSTDSTASVFNQVFPGPAAGDLVPGDVLVELSFTAETQGRADS